MARDQWAKVTQQVSLSRSIARIREEGEEGKDALNIFFMSLPHGGMYGLLPGDPAQFAALVCPLFRLTDEEAEAILVMLEAHDFYHRYTHGGKDLIWIKSYSCYQDTRWYRAGKCREYLPDCWTVPDDLTDELMKQLQKDEPRFAEHYGLRDSHLTQIPQYRELAGNARQRQAMPGVGGTEQSSTDQSSTNQSRAEGQGTAPPPAETTFEDYGPVPLSDREALTRRCCDILAPIAGKADACIVTVENVMASHVKAPDYILTACMELRARYEAGDRVHLSYLPRNVLDLIERDEARKSGSGAPPAGSGKYRGPGDPDKQPSSWEEALGRG